MDASTATNLWGFLAVTVMAIGGVLTARRTRDNSDQAANHDETQDSKDAAIEGYIALIKDYREDHESYRRRMEEIEHREDQNSRRLIQLERKVEDFQRLYRAAIRYIVELRRYALRFGSEAELPPPPEALWTDLYGDRNDAD